MVVLGKPMGNGFPVAALVVRPELLAAVPEETELFSTYGGNPVACAAALAVLDVIVGEDLVANAAATGAYLREGLLHLADEAGGGGSLIGDIRGQGLLLGVELVTDQPARTPAPGAAHQVTEAMRDRGILISATGPAGNVLKIRPPLVFRREHADVVLGAFGEALASISR
jgi:4-aminobutyrate aminotransferase-like enzyme